MEATNWDCDDKGEYTCPYDPATDQWRCPSVVHTKSTIWRPFKEMVTIDFDEYVGMDEKSKCGFWL